MPGTRTRRAVVFLTVYLMAIVAAMFIAFMPSGDGTGGIWITILGLPWSLFGVVVSDLLDPALTDKYGPTIGSASAILNAILLFWWTARDRRRTDRRPVE